MPSRTGAGFFHQNVSDAPGDLTLLIGGAAFEQRYLNHWHKGGSQLSVLSKIGLDLSD